MIFLQQCKQPFGGGSFFDHDGAPYCETHYHEKRGSLCAACLKPISGRCVTAMGRKFHPEHFVCSFCLRQLNKGTFKEHDNKPYCHQCFNKLLSWTNGQRRAPTMAPYFIFVFLFFFLWSNRKQKFNSHNENFNFISMLKLFGDQYSILDGVFHPLK